MRRLRIYLCAPLTNANTLSPEEIALNADRAAAMGAELLKHGFAPLIPQLTAGHDCLMAVHWALWIETGQAWIRVADAVLRLPGASKGTEEEVAFALARGVPVFDSLADLLTWSERQLGLDELNMMPGETQYVDGPGLDIPGMVQPPEPWPDPPSVRALGTDE